MKNQQDNWVVLPEFVADNLGAPFKVILKDSVKQQIDKSTGKVLNTTIPNPRDLLRKVALHRLAHPRKLNGEEIKFVRKALKIKAKDLAEMIDISVEHMSRCESGERILSPGIEKCLRLAIILHVFDIEDEIGNNEDEPSLKKELEAYRDAVNKLKNVFRDIDISCVHSADKPLSMTFSVRKSDETRDSQEQTEEQWDEAPRESMAA
ncbi:helix-turn-helix transcriptional regulator [uncultured Sphingopyxis sp.]|uniref:helix-turn-helix domain-containing protein n=1 Tax=uncultured Sphingopyxis sp. TaxID=310581 RepID=UPI0025CD86EC|nr:helix-turn-helix transcriptional regulator [uncultured Sphingopyxis sp.]